MNKRIERSIEAMKQIIEGGDPSAGLYINKVEGCLEVTRDKTRLSPMYEIADWVQFLTNHTRSRPSSDDLKELHNTFLILWNKHISHLTTSRTG
jgi:hypothetical protein